MRLLHAPGYHQQNNERDEVKTNIKNICMAKSGKCHQ